MKIKYFKDKNLNVFAYEADGSQDSFIKSDLTEMTQDEIDDHIAQKPQPAKTQFTALEFL